MFQTTVDLKIRLHCDGCMKKIKKIVGKINGEILNSAKVFSFSDTVKETNVVVSIFNVPSTFDCAIQLPDY